MAMTREEAMALEAGPELDSLIAERLMGWRRVPIAGGQEIIHFPDGGALAFPAGTPLHHFGVPPYSTSPHDANRMMPVLYGKHGYEVHVSVHYGGPFRCRIRDVSTGEFVADVEANTYALALCRAAVMVV